MASVIRRYLALSAVGVLAACGEVAAPGLFQAPPVAYLVPIDQLRDAGFEQVAPPSAMAAQAFSNAFGTGSDLNAVGFDSAGTERFFRTVSDIATTNGPIDVTATVARFASRDGAVEVMARDVGARDARPGEHAISTGPLGDEVHADEVVVADQHGTGLVQYTVEWRLGNLLNVVVVRGRSGGTRIADTVAIARSQLDRELGLVSPPPALPSPAPKAQPPSGAPSP